MRLLSLCVSAPSTRLADPSSYVGLFAADATSSSICSGVSTVGSVGSKGSSGPLRGARLDLCLGITRTSLDDYRTPQRPPAHHSMIRLLAAMRKPAPRRSENAATSAA